MKPFDYLHGKQLLKLWQGDLLSGLEMTMLNLAVQKTMPMAKNLHHCCYCLLNKSLLNFDEDDPWFLRDVHEQVANQLVTVMIAALSLRQHSYCEQQKYD
jgi:hypothetical protein